MIFNENFDSKNLINTITFHNDLRDIPQLYRASAEFASTSHPFFQVLLSKIDLTGGKYISIDSKLSMLVAGWYPSIPGWHCDDFYRPNGQPDLENLLPIKHYCCVLGADVCTTEFVAGTIELPSPTELYEVFDADKPLYGYYNELIEEIRPLKLSLEEGEIIKFSGRDFHRTVPAKTNGWRTFTRVTVSDHREPKNEIRTQTQVYLTAPFAGW